MILFRADANQTIGIGHIMRCLSIADALASLPSSTIISRDKDKNEINHNEVLLD